MSDKITNYLPIAQYEKLQHTIARKLLDTASTCLNNEIAETSVPILGVYICETSYSGYISGCMLDYINNELKTAEGSYKSMLESTKESVESLSLKNMCAVWESVFLTSQTKAMLQFNTNINPATSLPWVPPVTPYVVAEDYASLIDLSLFAPTPSILGGAIQSFMTSAFSTYGA